MPKVATGSFYFFNGSLNLAHEIPKILLLFLDDVVCVTLVALY